MRKLLVSVSCLACVLLQVSCLPSPETLEGRAPEAPKQTARALFEALRDGERDAVRSLVHPDGDPDEAVQTLLPLFEAVAGSQSLEPRFGSWSFLSQASESRHELSYEIALDQKFVVLSLVLEDHEEKLLISGVQYRILSSSLIESNRFTLEGKGALHHAFLAGSLATPPLCLVCAVVCWRRRPEYRWLWMLFILIGWPLLALDWSTGRIELKPDSVNLLGVSYSQAGPLFPFFLELGIPAGALVFLISRPLPRAELDRADPPEDGAVQA